MVIFHSYVSLPEGTVLLDSLLNILKFPDIVTLVTLA